MINRGQAEHAELTFRISGHDIQAPAPTAHVIDALGRTELVVFLEEWLKRIPDFELAHDGEIPVVGGTVAKILELPLVW